MFFKKTPPPTKPEYEFIWEGVIYSLKYPEDSFTYQYNLLQYILKSWINQEWIIAKALTSIPLNSHLIVQLSKINTRALADLSMDEYLSQITKDGEYSKAFSRLMETIALVSISCDNEFLDVLKARFFKAHTQYVYGKMYGREGNNALPTIDDWKRCSERYPWIWIIPHIQVAIAGDGNIQKEFIVLNQQQSRT